MIIMNEYTFPQFSSSINIKQCCLLLLQFLLTRLGRDSFHYQIQVVVYSAVCDRRWKGIRLEINYSMLRFPASLKGRWEGKNLKLNELKRRADLPKQGEISYVGHIKGHMVPSGDL